MKMRTWKKMVALTMASVMTAGMAVIPAFAEEYTVDEPVALKVLWCQSTTESGLEDTIEEVLAENYPNITIDWELITWEDLPSKMQQYMQSGMPDIVIAKSQDANNYAEYGVWADMTGTSYIDKVYDSALYGVTINDQILGMPYIGSYGGVYYNRTIFEELGLEVPTTYEELEEVCKVISENGITPFGTHFLDAWYHGWALAIATGGELITGSETWGNEFRDGTRDANDEEFITGLEGFQLLHDYTWEDCYSVEQTTCDARFIKGESAMQFDMSGVAATFMELDPELDFGIFPYPTAEGNGNLNMEPNCTFFKCAATEQGEAVDAFMSVMASPEMATEWSQYVREASLIEGAESFETFCQSDIDYYAEAGLTRDQNKITNQLPYNEFWADLSSDYTEYVQGSIDLDTVLERANSRRDVCGE